MVNATAASAGGCDPLHAVIAASALAVAEDQQLTLSELRRGIAIGLEVAARLFRALGPSHVERGYEPAGTVGRVAGSAAVAVCLGLDEFQTRSSFSYTATAAAGLSSSPYVSFIAGLAARDAAEAGLFARAGLIGPPAPLEGRRGLLALESKDGDVDALSEDLGSVFFAQELYFSDRFPATELELGVGSVSELVSKTFV
jgi:2-methylcitrate dehydratase PrpD